MRRAIRTARISGWSTAIFAAFSLLFGLFSMTSLVLGIVMSIVAYNEFAGANLIGRLDLRGPRRLGFNQLFFCASLVVYSLWSIFKVMTTPDALAAQLGGSGEVADMLGPLADMARTITLSVYIALIPLSVIFQGGAALWYFSRRKHLLAYTQKTPAWIIELHKRVGAV